MITKNTAILEARRFPYLKAKALETKVRIGAKECHNKARFSNKTI
jgi:hypothetical protein